MKADKRFTIRGGGFEFIDEETNECTCRIPPTEERHVSAKDMTATQAIMAQVQFKRATASAEKAAAKAKSD